MLRARNFWPRALTNIGLDQTTPLYKLRISILSQICNPFVVLIETFCLSKFVPLFQSFASERLNIFSGSLGENWYYFRMPFGSDMMQVCQNPFSVWVSIPRLLETIDSPSFGNRNQLTCLPTSVSLLLFLCIINFPQRNIKSPLCGGQCSLALK